MWTKPFRTYPLMRFTKPSLCFAVWRNEGGRADTRKALFSTNIKLEILFLHTLKEKRFADRFYVCLMFSHSFYVASLTAGFGVFFPHFPSLAASPQKFSTVFSTSKLLHLVFQSHMESDHFWISAEFFCILLKEGLYKRRRVTFSTGR